MRYEIHIDPQFMAFIIEFHANNVASICDQ